MALALQKIFCHSSEARSLGRAVSTVSAPARRSQSFGRELARLASQIELAFTPPINH